MPKLNWSVKKGPDGKIVRRKLANDGLDQDCIDVEWTHADGFPPDYIMVPVTNSEYKKKELPAKKVIADCILVNHDVTDGTVCMMLDEKRPRLAKSLGVPE